MGDTMVDTTVIPDTVITVIITASVPLNRSLLRIPRIRIRSWILRWIPWIRIWPLWLLWLILLKIKSLEFQTLPENQARRKKKILFNLQPPQNSLLFPFL